MLYLADDLEVIHHFAIGHFELAILQVGVADKHVLVAADQLLDRQQTGSGIHDSDTTGQITRRDIGNVRLGFQPAVRNFGYRIAASTRPQ